MNDQIKRIMKISTHGPINLALRSVDGPLKPKRLWFGVTDRCNSHCTYCNIWRQKPTTNLLSPDEIESALSDPLFSDVEYIINSGGEPTLRQDLKEVIMAEHKAIKKARINISTNGLLPERIIDVAKYALQDGIDLEISTSVDAIGEEHDRIRGNKGNFEKVDRLLHELVALRNQYGCDKRSPSFGYTLTDQTLPFFDEVQLYAKQLDVDYGVQWYNQSAFYGNTGKNLSTSNNDMIKKIRAMPDSIMKNMWLNSLKGKSIKFSCFAMYTFCVLQCDGNISPCLSLWDTIAGNVRESSPTEIWHSTKAQEMRKTVKNCQGCLNSWGTYWSFESSCYPYLLFSLKHPAVTIVNLKKKK